MICCVCKKNPRHGDLMLCEGCLGRFRKDPASLKKSAPPERKPPENKPMKGSGGGIGVPYRTVGTT